MKMKNFLKLSTAMIALAFIAACGGGGNDPVVAGTATVNGTASKGLIKNGVIKIYAANSNGTKGALLTSATTDGQGRYSATVTGYSGAIIIEATGNYTDEATGATTPVEAGDPLVAAGTVSANGTVSIAVTPLTDLAYHKAVAAASSGTAIGTAISNANAEVSTQFAFDITTVQPVDANSSNLQGATAQQKAYTLYLAGISQLAKDSNKTVQQVIDSLNAAGSGAGNQVVTSVNTFLASNTNNQTGYKRLPVTLSISGLAAQRVGGLDFTLSFPAGVLVNADQNGALAPCEYSLGNSTTTNPVMAVTKYTAASGNTRAKLRMIILNTNLLSNGPVGVLKLNVPGTVQAADFTVESVTAKDQNGATIPGVTLGAQ